MTTPAVRSYVARGLGALVMALVLAVGCGGGGEDGGEGRERARPGEVPDERTPTERAPTDQAAPTDGAAPTEQSRPQPPRGFSRAVGGLCSGFYDDAAALQQQLQGLGVSANSPQSVKRRALGLVDRIQSRSGRFLRDLRRVALPEGSAARADARELVASTARFLGLQRASTDFVRRLVLGRPADPDARARLQRLQGQLGSELRVQQALARKLSIPECLSSSAGATG